MKKLKTAIAITVFAALTAIPSQAVAENIVPPGNSAATQYTETFPTAGGNAAIKNSSIGGGEKRSPDKVLGHSTTKKLEEHGNEGRAVVELASEGAPAPSSSTGGGHGGGSGGSGGSAGSGGQPTSGGGGGGGSPGHASAGGGNGGNGSSAAGSHTAGNGAQQSTAIPAASAATAQVSGDSGPSAILAQATGSSGGTMGIFLPLLLILALAWAVAYSWRRQRLKRAAL